MGGKARLLSADLERGLNGMRQAVLDLRRACDWIATQPDLDAGREIRLQDLERRVSAVASVDEDDLFDRAVVAEEGVNDCGRWVEASAR